MHYLGDFSQVTYDDFTRFAILQVMSENYYHEQLPQISTCTEYSIDFYHKYILPFCFGNVNSRDYHGDSLNVMFHRFPNCFLPFPLVFPHVSLGVSTVSFGVSPGLPAVFALFPILDFAYLNLQSFLHFLEIKRIGLFCFARFQAFLLLWNFSFPVGVLLKKSFVTVH